MSSSSSDSSRASTVAGLTRKLALPRSSMSIQLDHDYSSKVYTTGSTISGHVLINTTKDIRFDAIQVLFLGVTRTRVDGVRTPHVTSHTFLKLQMPIPDSSYPVPRVYEAGRTYVVPFHFVVPPYLTINACNHHIKSDAVQDQHLFLPPTMGYWNKDDLSPDMAQVDYSVVARVYRELEVNGKRAKLMETNQRVKVLPAHTEQPPLSLTKNDKLYTMSKSKSLKKTLLSAKTGKVTVTATQPGAAMLRPDGHTSSTTMVPIDLRFDPASIDCLPPKVTGISSKLTGVTFFSASGISNFPSMGDWGRSFGADGLASYSNTVSLFSTPVDNINWSQKLTSEARRDSGYSSSLPSDTDLSSDRRRGSKNQASPIYYATKLHVPIQLPVDKKMFIPTFNSCIASRVYVLWLTVSLLSGSSSSSLTLGVPLQVGVESTESSVDHTGLPSFEAALEEAEADAYLRPRTLHVPDVHFERTALPDYTDALGRAA